MCKGSTVKTDCLIRFLHFNSLNKKINTNLIQCLKMTKFRHNLNWMAENYGRD